MALAFRVSSPPTSVVAVVPLAGTVGAPRVNNPEALIVVWEPAPGVTSTALMVRSPATLRPLLVPGALDTVPATCTMVPAKPLMPMALGAKFKLFATNVSVPLPPVGEVTTGVLATELTPPKVRFAAPNTESAAMVLLICVPSNVNELKVGAAALALAPRDTGANKSMLPWLEMRTAPAACSDASKPVSMLSVSGEVPDPTKATLFDARDQLAPLPLMAPFRMTLPGASTASAPPELKLDPDSSAIVAPVLLP